ncbi:MAG TPA: L,D-transpeptidase family protein [Allosphingosinicella sp.]|uniref:L,D-transpeptidase family protein n=1 Tax=Allosphingosinicella sp. TaxID=2823234 RepID=UPI002EDA0669
MSRILKSTIIAALCATAMPAGAQLKKGEKPTEQQIAAGEAPATPISEAETVYRGLQGTMVARPWNREAAQDLLSYISRVNEEGLEPSEYGLDALESALAGRDQAAVDRAATDSFLKLSAALALGTVPMTARTDWHLKDEDLDGATQFSLMEKAIAARSVRQTLDSLLPTHLQYGELKDVLANATDLSTVEAARVNLERWRWLPRELGPRYVIVNVPAYTVALVENGHVVARHKAVVGAVKTPTPQLGATATGVIFNPWWEVPASIAPEVRGKKGYVSVKTPEGGVRYRQPPGPGNSLGRMKVVMPNNYAIYLHDTPSKALFSRPARAASHGCIRTQNPLEFARLLLGNPEWDQAKIDATIKSGKTVKADTSVPTPVYIAYFTAAAQADGKGIIRYKDVYNRDAKVVASIKNGGKTALASK